MKTRILKPALSLSATAFAVFAAFAFSTAPEKEKLIDVFGHNPAEDCDVTEVECTTIQNDNLCTIQSGTQQLFEMSSPTECATPLWKKPGGN